MQERGCRARCVGDVRFHVVEASAPQHVEYELTDLGHTLEKPLAAICDWAISQQSPQ